MKKLLLFFITLVLSVSIYAQTSPVGLSRIASATTAFGSPLPFGWKVFDGNTKLTYTVIEATGVAGTATLTSASSSFQLDTPDLSVYELLSNKQSNLTASTTKYPTVNAVNTGLGLKQDALGFTPYNSTNPSSYIPLTALSSTATGLTYTNTTGVFSLTSGYAIPTTTNISTWNSLVSASGYLPLSAGSGNALTGNLYIGNATGQANIYLNRSSTTSVENAIRWETNSSPEWYLGSGASGANSDFELYGYGTSAVNFKIAKSTGAATFSSTVAASQFNPTNLTANYLPKMGTGGLVNSLISDDGSGILTINSSLSISTGSSHYNWSINPPADNGWGYALEQSGSSYFATAKFSGNGTTDRGFRVWNATTNDYPFIVYGTGVVSIPLTTASTSSTTGALVVGGGIASAKDIWWSGGALTNTYTGNNAFTGDRAAVVLINGSVRSSYQADNTNSLARIGTETANDFQIITNNSEKLRVTSAGSVYIGYIADPTSGNKLAVNGNAYVGGSVTATGATFTTGAGSGKVWTSDGSGVGSWAALGGAAYKGQIDGSTGSGLADGTGTTGWYYACSTAGTHNYGSGNITLAIGDQLYYNGSIWLKIPGAGSYALPTASSSVLGGVKSGSVVTVDGSGVLGFSNPGYISGNQTITLGGILSGSGTTSISASAASGYYMPTTTDQTNWNEKTSYNDLPYPQKFTEAATGSTGQVNTLDHTPKGGKVLSVAQNGSILDPAKYTVSGATVQVTSPVYANDQITVSFIY
jgi:hypothetical protein